MRILFHLGYPGLLRMFGSTVRELSARGHEILLAYDVPEKRRSPAVDEIESLPGVSVADPVPWSGGRTPADLQRRSIDYLRYLDRRLSGTPYQARLERKTPDEALEFAGRRFARLWAKPYIRALVWRDRFRPPDVATRAYVRSADPDIIVVTPLVSRGEWGVRQTETVKAARDLGVPVVAAIASWDHLTTKGLIKVLPNRVLVWNDTQRREARQLHRVPRRRIVVTGAQLFDQWFSRGPSTTREAFLAPLGIDPARPFVLYTGSSPNITPADREIEFVRDWLRRLRDAGSPLREIGAVVRPHPGNMDAWAGVDLADLGGAVVPRERPGLPMSETDESLYFDSIHHASAVVGINTTAIIEALIQRRPVLTIRTPEFAQEDTVHFGYLLPDAGGCVRLARTLDEHLAQLDDVLAHPERERQDIERFLRTFVRPHGLDLPATPIVADAIERAGRLARRRSVPSRLAFSGGVRMRLAARLGRS